MAKSIGGWAFIVGLVLAIVIALLGVQQNWAIYVLAILGLIVGLMNVSDKEVLKFLVAAIAFITTFTALSKVFAPIPLIGGFLESFFGLLVVFVAPATAVVAISALLSITKD